MRLLWLLVINIMILAAVVKLGFADSSQIYVNIYQKYSGGGNAAGNPQQGLLGASANSPSFISGSQLEPLVFTVYDVVFRVTVHSSIQGVPNQSNMWGVYYASCPPGASDYTPPGGPPNIGVAGIQGNVANCGCAGTSCAANMWSEYNYYVPGVGSYAYCTMPVVGWIPISAVRAAQSQVGATGNFVSATPLLNPSPGYYYTVVTSSNSRSVTSSNPIPGYVLTGNDLNGEYEHAYSTGCW